MWDFFPIHFWLWRTWRPLDAHFRLDIIFLTAWERRLLEAWNQHHPNPCASSFLLSWDTIPKDAVFNPTGAAKPPPINLRFTIRGCNSSDAGLKLIFFRILYKKWKMKSGQNGQWKPWKSPTPHSHCLPYKRVLNYQWKMEIRQNDQWEPWKLPTPHSHCLPYKSGEWEWEWDTINVYET